jgi:hypothetical protein
MATTKSVNNTRQMEARRRGCDFFTAHARLHQLACSPNQAHAPRGNAGDPKPEEICCGEEKGKLGFISLSRIAIDQLSRIKIRLACR